MVTPQEARKLVSKLEKPDRMRLPTWRRLQKVLRSLCDHLPDPYPGINRLSHRTKIPPRTVARLLTQAEGSGLLARVERTIPGHFDGYSYRLMFLDQFPVPTPVPTSGQVGTEEEELRSSSLTTFGKKTSGRFADRAGRPRKINQYDGRCHVCLDFVLAGEGFLHGHGDRWVAVHPVCDLMPRRVDEGDPAGWPEPVGGDVTPLPVHTITPPKPQARLAKYFEERWNTDALGLHPEWRGEYRGLIIGAAIGYIRRTFLDAGYSVEHVEAMIDAFFDDLLNPYCTLEIKQGQNAFQLFTGWWGHNLVPDPVLERQKQAHHDRMVKAAREQSAISKRAWEAAWERIDAALEQGKDPDPEDLKAAGLPPVRVSRKTS